MKELTRDSKRYSIMPGLSVNLIHRPVLPSLSSLCLTSHSLRSLTVCRDMRETNGAEPMDRRVTEGSDPTPKPFPLTRCSVGKGTHAMKEVNKAWEGRVQERNEWTRDIEVITAPFGHLVSHFIRSHVATSGSLGHVYQSLLPGYIDL